MIVKVSLFAAAKDIVGSDTLELTLGEGATVAMLKAKIIEGYSDLAGIIERSAIAVDHQYADDSTNLHDGAEIGLIPPVSGG